MLRVTIRAGTQKRKPGKPHTLSLANQLLLTLGYLSCHYHTQPGLAVIYGLFESTVVSNGIDTARLVNTILILFGTTLLSCKTG